MAIKIIADKNIPFLKGVFELYADIEYYQDSQICNQVVKDADALIIRTRTKCDKELLEGSSVQFIASATIGFDHIDVEYCNKRNIQWTNAPGCNSGSVLQYVSAALLLYAKRNNIDLTKRVLGVIGVGNVGSKIVHLAESLNMPVLLNDPPRVRKEGPCGFMSFEGTLREADIISMHVPLILNGNDRTFHLIDHTILKQLNSDSLIINSSRGEVMKTSDLIRGCSNGSIKDLIIDVWEEEPRIDKNLLNSSFIGTPHIAGYSVDGKSKGTQMSVHAISRFFGLGLDEWLPDDLPTPSSPVISYNGLGKSFQEILTDLVLTTYDIESEDELLKQNPLGFEDFRRNYGIRREFNAYKLDLENVNELDKSKLEDIGFRLM